MNINIKSSPKDAPVKSEDKEAYFNRIWFGVILTLALIVRIGAFYLIVGETSKYFSNPDAIEYEKIARNLIKYGTFAQEPNPPLTPNIYRTPIYPTMLAGIYAITNSSPAAVILIQVIIGSLAATLIFLLSSKLNFPREVGIIASLIVILDPLTVLTTLQLITETLFTMLLLLGFLFLADYRNTAKFSSLVMASVCIAMSTLTRPISQFLPFALLPILLIIDKSIHLDWKKHLTQVLLFLLVSLLLTQAWAYRNYREAGIWTISAISDKNLYYYRALDVIAKAENISEEEAEQQLKSYIEGEREKSNLSEAQTVALMRKEALSIFRQYPIQTLDVHVTGLAKVIINPGLGLVCVMLNQEGDLSGCAAGDTTSSLNALTTKFSDMDNLQLAVAIWAIVLLLFVYILAGIGIYYLLRERNWSVLLFSLIPIFYFALLSAGGESDSRFRIPFLPFLSILAGIGLVNLYRFIKSRKKINIT